MAPTPVEPLKVVTAMGGRYAAALESIPEGGQMVSPGVEFRQAVLSDMPRARQLHELLLPDDPHVYAECIRYPKTCNMVAVKGGEVIGYVSSLTADSEPNARALWRRIRPYVGFLGVHPDHQRQGVGTALLLRACERLFEMTGAPTVYLETRPETLEVYTKAGFVPMTAEEVESAFGPNPSNSIVCRLQSDQALGAT